MKVAFIHPNTRVFSVIPNLGFAHLSAVVKASGHEATVLLANKEKYSLERMLGWIGSEKPDVVGLQAFTYFFPVVSLYAKKIKEAYPSITIVAGGPHPSGVGGGILKDEPSIDYAFRGEAESGIVSFLDALAHGAPEGALADVGGLIWRSGRSAGGGQVMENGLAPVADLDALPHPDWSMMPPDSFPLSVYGGFSPGYPVAPVALSRGCNFNCEFCTTRAINGVGTRFFTAGYVVEEILSINSGYGVSSFAFIDQNLFQNRDRAIELLHEIKSRCLPKGIRWYCPNGVRADSICEELISLAAEAGCYGITIGIESGSDDTLRAMNKNVSVERLRSAISLVRKYNIKTTGNFMYGYPEEPASKMYETMRFSLSLSLDRAQYAIFVPYPGTAHYKVLSAEGRVPSWDKFKIHCAHFVAPEKQLVVRLILIVSFLLFFIRPKIFRNLMSEVISPSHFLYIIKRWLIVWLGLL